jgi:hypothetical protein
METATLLVLLLLASPAGSDPGPAVAEALRVETPFGDVLVTPQVPAGHYGERYGGESFWLPGVDEGSSLVRKVIKTAHAHRDRGERVQLTSYLQGARRVYVTDQPPFPGVFWMRVGDQHAWIAGVEKPKKADVKALERTADALEAAAATPQVATAPR